MKIRVLSKQLIKPSSPTPPDRRDYKLSFIEERIPHSYIPLILYYSAQQNRKIEQPEISKWLRSSLSEALTQFYPMAGRIKGQTSIDCNDEGIFYAEAEVDAHLSELLHQTPDVQILDQLSPRNSCGTVSDAKELLAIQVNFFRCGGLAIGMCQSHRIADACTFSSFIKSWANKAAKSYGLNNVLEPEFNSASLFPPRGTADFRPNPQTSNLQPPVENLVTRRFVFSFSEIESLKSKVMDRSSTAKPTRVQVVSAYIWKCCISAAGLGQSDMSVAFHPVNLRRRTIPPLKESSFGNIFQTAYAETNGGEDWIGLVERLRVAIGKIDQHFCEKLLGENGYEVVTSNFSVLPKYLAKKDVQIVFFSSWCGFLLYEADFGWGNPVWVSSTSYSCKNSVFLFDSRSPGAIEAWIVMAEKDFAKFEQEMDHWATCRGSSNILSYCTSSYIPRVD